MLSALIKSRQYNLRKLDTNVSIDIFFHIWPNGSVCTPTVALHSILKTIGLKVLESYCQIQKGRVLDNGQLFQG